MSVQPRRTRWLPSAVFLDRDGVINVDSPDYIKSREEFHPIPGSIEAISRLTQRGVGVIVITNQSAINRGMVPLAELETMHRRMRQAVADSDGSLTDIFFCPHRPDEGCDCRKPKPGMILAARDRYGIDLSSAVMVGDSAKDIACARRAGVRYAVLVKTGNFAKAQQEMKALAVTPDQVAQDLYEAVEWLLEQFQSL